MLAVDLRHRFTRSLALVLALAGLVVTGAVNAPTASAAVAAVVQRPSTGVTADALPTVQINGVIWDQVIVGNTVYAGGQFTSARPAGAPLGTSETPRSNLLAYNLTTGALITTFAPTFNGVVKALAVTPDHGRLIVGGDFSVVNGKSRSRLAVFAVSTGNLIAGFAPVFNTRVNTLAVTSSVIYAGGWFTAVNSLPRARVAAISLTDGSVLPFAPSADANVNAMTLTGDGSELVVGGQFATLNGVAARGLGAFDTRTGATLPWATNALVQDYGPNSSITSLKTVGDTVYGTGYRFGSGNGTFEGVFAAAASTGAVTWLQDCHGDSYDSTLFGGVVYSVSHAHDCSNIGAFDNVDDEFHYSTAVTADARGTVARNDETGYNDFRGQPAPAMVNWFPGFAVGTYTGQYQAGWTVESSGSYVVEGGEFTKVNGVAQQGLVRFAVPSVAANKQGPQATLPLSATNLLTSIRFTTTTDWDTDDQVLTYNLYRDAVTSAVCTKTATSQFWNRPSLTCTVSSPPSGTHSYKMTVSDPNGNTVTSASVSVTR